MNSRKNPTLLWSLTSILMVLALVLAACGSTATPEPATNTPEPVAPTATTEPSPVPEPTATAGPVTTILLADFESDSNVYDGYQAAASLGDVAQTGAASLKSESDTGEWHGVGLEFAAPVDLSQHGKLCFWAYDTTAFNDGQARNTVGVKLIDAAGKATERYTDNEGVGANPKTKKDAWVPMCLNLVTFTDMDLTQVAKIEFTMYWAGVYYFDEIAALAQGDELAIPEPAGETATVVAQDFEAEDTYYSDYQAEVSLSDVAHGGKSALKAASDSGEWHAFGALLSPSPFDASASDKLCFWIQDTTANNGGKADNTVGVSLIDAAGVKDEIWTDNELAGGNPKTVKDEWVQMCLNLAAYTKADLTQIEKVQFAMFWAGTYYVDEIAFVSGGAAPAATTVLQDFEKEETYYSDYQAEVSLGDVAHGGKTSLMSVSTEGEWHAQGAYPDPRPVDISGQDKLCFWIQDTTANNGGKADNTVGVSLIDAAGVKDEVWTDAEGAGTNPKTVKDEWTQMCLNLAAYTKADLTQIDKIQFAMFWAGTYYFDDITVVGAAQGGGGEPVLAQGFEAEDTYYSDYQAEVSLGDVAHGGKTSLKSVSDTGDWHAQGAFPDTRPFDASAYSKMCFWIQDTTANNGGKADNTVGVSLIDAAGVKDEVWTDAEGAGTNPKTVKDEWTQMCLNLAAYTKADLTQIDKIQFAMFWAGTYYFDDIEFVP